MAKVYAVIWKNYCAKEVQYNIEEISDFKTRIKNNPLELLKEVESLMHVPQKEKYPPLTLVEVLCNFMRVKQAENESLLEYMSSFVRNQSVKVVVWQKNS